jgi:CRISPR-associated protein Csx3
VVNPVGLHDFLPSAAPRQANVYFSSSDADFADRYEAAARWGELRGGRVSVRGGWRLYSSGPGLFVHKVRACLLGLRESFGDVVFDPVLPRSLDGLEARVELCGQPVQVHYRVVKSTHAPSAVVVNGTAVGGGREPNPYRAGGWRVPSSILARLLATAENRIEIEL